MTKNLGLGDIMIKSFMSQWAWRRWAQQTQAQFVIVVIFGSAAARYEIVDGFAKWKKREERMQTNDRYGCD
ncbi:hypothetical protein BU24DRAFT_418418 [Aaosphaeria arxii CBS 175.79]|uniref:Uncharacterized protein n=1 Tax=Aaosphaeria arxii CBS 175.79 TaxID=1450172 RepID=A0A6A5Y208_9PLEO|nr:uncharacterized protein BU24DRAFT_418418 [Aaosphaeria arxii CBS 175.79]KAF2018860.1 hypothetical protein BU24DRAFT_418418 [Aaosphaeria arxii CBS 175.79]